MGRWQINLNVWLPARPGGGTTQFLSTIYLHTKSRLLRLTTNKGKRSLELDIEHFDLPEECQSEIYFYAVLGLYRLRCTSNMIAVF